MLHFDWDESKNKSNRQKHGIDFEHAKQVFEDEDAVAYPGQTKDGENRIWYCLEMYAVHDSAIKSKGNKRNLEVCSKYSSKFAVPIAREQT